MLLCLRSRRCWLAGWLAGSLFAAGEIDLRLRRFKGVVSEIHLFALLDSVMTALGVEDALMW